MPKAVASPPPTRRHPERVAAPAVQSVLASPIELVVGLGNPGPDYLATRHNAGFRLVDDLARRWCAPFRKESKFSADTARASTPAGAVWLLKPHTFMNASGRAVAALMRYYDIAPDAVLVAHDELDLAPGVIRLKFGGGHGGHNGLRDIGAQLGTGDFVRLRIGIGRPAIGGDVTAYVLSRPDRADAQLIDGAIERVQEVMPDLLRGDLARAMNALHSAPPAA